MGSRKKREKGNFQDNKACSRKKTEQVIRGKYPRLEEVLRL